MRDDISSLHKSIMQDNAIQTTLARAGSSEEMVGIILRYAEEAGLSVTENEILPYLPSPSGELSDDQLEFVVGGKGESKNFDDTLHGGAGNDVLSGYEGNDTLYGHGGDDRLDGDAGNDLLYGGDGNDTLYGDSGNDTLHGGSGDDTIVGGSGADTIIGGSGKDLIGGGSGDDYISGGAGNDQLQGGSGDDVMDGGAGNDLFRGDSGDDTLTGGAGGDFFAFDKDDGHDTITDFNTEEDWIGIPKGTDKADLSVMTHDGNTIIAFGDTIITLEGVELERDDLLDRVRYYTGGSTA